MVLPTPALQSTSARPRHTSLLTRLLIILGSFGFILFACFFVYILTQPETTPSAPESSEEIVIEPTSLPQAVDVQVAITERLQTLADLHQRRLFGTIYDSFVSPRQKIINRNYYGDYRSLYVQSISQATQEYGKDHLEFAVNDIRVEADKAYVDRTLTYCRNQDCSVKTAEQATIEWYQERGKWYTLHEEPLCVRERPYDTSASLEGEMKVTEALSGVEIILQPECGMFPIYFREPPSNSHVTELSPTEVTRSAEILQTALHKYPPALLQQLLDKIYVVDSMSHYGADYGGTYAFKNLYLVNSGTTTAFDTMYFEQSFHHELSSLLLIKFDPYYKQTESTWFNPTWKSFNQPEFTYGSGGVEMIKAGFHNTSFDPEFIKQGFLNEYSTSSMENDFNEITKHLFVGTPEFWKIVDSNEVINNKVQFAIEFYHQLDPMFTEEYFRSLSEDRHAW